MLANVRRAIASSKNGRRSRAGQAMLMLVAVSGFVATLHDQSHAFFGADEYDISSFCNAPSPRRTVVYIDDEMMEDQNTVWATRLYQKLNASFLPSEPVSVVQLSPTTGSSKEIWSACWPDVTAEQREKLSKQTPWLTKAPLKILETQQSVFRQGLAGALSRIFQSAKRPKQEILSGRGSKRKGLVAALMADESRFHASRSSARVIIYSDMIENSAYANVRGDGTFSKLGGELSEKLKFDARGATFYVFGMEAGPNQAQKIVEQAKDFWTAFFRESNGYVGGLGSELNIPAAPAATVATYDIEVKVEGGPRFGRLHIFADSKGQMQDSYLFFSTKANSSLNGTFSCRSPERCSLDAKTTSGTVTLLPSEEIRLEGPMQKLVGSVGFPNDFIQGSAPTSQNHANWDATATLRAE